MVNYRRARVPGATYFFTVTLKDRRKTYLISQVEVLRSVVRTVWRERPFVVDAFVILPDHLHAVCTLPAGDADYSGRWRAIKARFSRALAAAGVSIVRNGRGEYNLWQRRFWEHLIRDDGDFARHVDYIHYNPVKHGLAADPFAWRWSSIHGFARRGLVSRDWQGRDQDGSFGD
ncbi:MAG: transposase [Defluviicoccus sp.]|nr:transposase [Defluviicoccus sp.]